MRLLLVAIAALCLANPAWAELRVTSHVGSWDVFSGTGTDGRQTCGVGNTNPTNGQAFSLRYALGGDGVTFVAAKPSWNIPEGTRIPVVMQVGLDRPWTEQAVGHGDRVEWTMDRTTVQSFDTQFRRELTMTVTFPAGSEPPWIVSLHGSTAASNAMGRCVTEMTQSAAAATPAPAPAQPASPTQPYAASPAAPAAGASPTQPTQLAPQH